MPDPDPVVLKPGTRLRSAVCATEVMVIQAPAAPVSAAPAPADELHNLRISERAFQLGDAFELGKFHDEFLSKGIIPVTLIRWEMTGHDDEVTKLWSEVVGAS